MDRAAQAKSENENKGETTQCNNMRVAVFTLGCKVNQYESQAIVASLCALGFAACEGLTEADIYVINTCSVTCEADKKSRQAVARALKQNPDARVIITGCSSQNNAQSFLDKKQVVAVFGSGNKIKNITEIVSRLAANRVDNQIDNQSGNHIGNQVYSQTNSPKTAQSDNKTSDDLSNDNPKVHNNLAAKIGTNAPADFEIPPGYEDDMSPTPAKTRAYIKIQDGCNNFCAYCRIPYLRGRSRSRPLSSAVAEYTRLSQQAKEIVITGIDISSYGKDIGTSLTTLLQHLCQNEPKLQSQIQNQSQNQCQLQNQKESNPQNSLSPRKRLGSLECGIITADLLKAMQDANFCDHFHLSLQSGSDTVLARMNRHYSTAEFLKKIELIRKYYPYAGITTDIIAGFSEETEQEHAETLQFLQKAEFSDIHVFPYSPRKGTKAYNLPLTDKTIRESRAREIAEIAEKLRLRFVAKNLGRAIEVYAEQRENGYTTGFTSNYIKVYTGLKPGELKPQRLVEIFQKGVLGKDV